MEGKIVFFIVDLAKSTHTSSTISVVAALFIINEVISSEISFRYFYFLATYRGRGLIFIL